ncbi:MAG: type IV secretion system protein [Alphaproteobacteria bacterium]|jgi:type IV secretory pathway component VirB8|nr:type IV secretion system protein [Alphaproteobacteria bacterium]
MFSKIKEFIFKITMFFKGIKNHIPLKNNNGNDKITTSKKNFDLRGVFSFLPLDNGNIVRKEEYLLRLSSLMIVGLLAIVILLCIIIKTILPLQKIEPVFLSTSSSDNQVYWVEPLEKKEKAFRLITESLITQYIEARESIDLQTEQERYEYVRWLSNLNVVEEFDSSFDKDKKENEAMKRAKLFRLSKGVKITVIDFLSDNQLQADFDIYEYKRATGEIVSKKEARATIKIIYEPEKVDAKNRYMNPLGLRVVDYSIAIKHLEEFIILREQKNEN